MRSPVPDYSTLLNQYLEHRANQNLRELQQGFQSDLHGRTTGISRAQDIFIFDRSSLGRSRDQFHEVSQGLSSQDLKGKKIFSFVNDYGAHWNLVLRQIDNTGNKSESTINIRGDGACGVHAMIEALITSDKYRQEIVNLIQNHSHYKEDSNSPNGYFLPGQGFSAVSSRNDEAQALLRSYQSEPNSNKKIELARRIYYCDHCDTSRSNRFLELEIDVLKDFLNAKKRGANKDIEIDNFISDLDLLRQNPSNPTYWAGVQEFVRLSNILDIPYFSEIDFTISQELIDAQKSKIKELIASNNNNEMGFLFDFLTTQKSISDSEALELIDPIRNTASTQVVGQISGSMIGFVVSIKSKSHGKGQENSAIIQEALSILSNTDIHKATTLNSYYGSRLENLRASTQVFFNDQSNLDFQSQFISALDAFKTTQDQAYRVCNRAITSLKIKSDFYRRFRRQITTNHRTPQELYTMLVCGKPSVPPIADALNTINTSPYHFDWYFVNNSDNTKSRNDLGHNEPIKFSEESARILISDPNYMNDWKYMIGLYFKTLGFDFSNPRVSNIPSSIPHTVRLQKIIDSICFVITSAESIGQKDLADGLKSDLCKIVSALNGKINLYDPKYNKGLFKTDGTLVADVLNHQSSTKSYFQNSATLARSVTRAPALPPAPVAVIPPPPPPLLRPPATSLAPAPAAKTLSSPNRAEAEVAQLLNELKTPDIAVAGSVAGSTTIANNHTFDFNKDLGNKTKNDLKNQLVAQLKQQENNPIPNGPYFGIGVEAEIVRGSDGKYMLRVAKSFNSQNGLKMGDVIQSVRYQQASDGSEKPLDIDALLNDRTKDLNGKIAEIVKIFRNTDQSKISINKFEQTSIANPTNIEINKKIFCQDRQMTSLSEYDPIRHGVGFFNSASVPRATSR